MDNLNIKQPRRYKKYDQYVGPARRRVSPTVDGFVNRRGSAVAKSVQTVVPKYSSRPQQIQANIQPARPLNNGQQIALRAVARSVNPANSSSFESQLIAPPHKKHASFIRTFMNVVGLAVFIFAVGVSAQTMLLNNQAKGQIAVLGEQTKTDEQGVVQGSGDEPAEDAITEEAFWSYKPINPEHPRYLRIPELSVYARIKNLGLTNDGAIDAPANIHDVGWYNKGAIPGSTTGTSLLLGHVSGWTEDGVFKKLSQMTEGMQFQVEKGSGKVITYEVYKKQSFPLDQIDMQAILNADTAGVHDLKLMTCAGKYDVQRETYLDRMVVYARVAK